MFTNPKSLFPFSAVTLNKIECSPICDSVVHQVKTPLLSMTVHQSVDHSKMFGKGVVHISGIEGFWSFAKENMAKHHDESIDKFLLYIKEMEIQQQR